MRPRILALLLVFAGLPLVVACDDDEGPELPRVSGSWEGVSNGVTFSMSLFENDDGTIFGSGTTSSTSASFPYDVTGGHVFPVVQLQLAVVDAPDVLTLDGHVTFDSLSTLLSLDASVSGGGFDRFPIQLKRK